MSTVPYHPTELSAGPWHHQHQHQHQRHLHHTFAQASSRPPERPDSVIFVRKLWSRNMPDEGQGESDVLNKSQSRVSQIDEGLTPRSTRADTSSVNLRPRHRSPSPSPDDRVPLTPEESPLVKSTRKRSAGIVEQEDKATAGTEEVSHAHSRANSGEHAVHVCICQPDPKIPRPRNAFILYRQHNQAEVVSHHPGLANPEISKIIGERWQNLPQDEKNRWKSLAEEEKLRHQVQYPQYRYQPKRHGRRNSVSDIPGAPGEKPKCQKCGGRTMLAPTTPFAAGNGAVVPLTPKSSTTTPVTRTLPVFHELSLQSPAGQYPGRHHPSMSPPCGHLDERDDLGPLSPGNKRRRFNVDHPSTITRAMPPRYGVGQAGTATGPGTPFPFVTVPAQTPYPLAFVQSRRESLPGLRGVVSPPEPMGPPPRPGMGYQQHRMSQGHIVADRSLTLPPLQVGHVESAEPSVELSKKSAEEMIMDVPFRYKVQVLSQIAPPATRTEGRRGPFIAIEGDSPAAAKSIAEWLKDNLAKDDLLPSLVQGPDVSPSGSKQQIMAQYHRLAADWLIKSNDILESIIVPAVTTGPADTTMSDAGQDTASVRSSKEIDEDYDIVEDADITSDVDGDSHSKASEKRESISSCEKMEVDPTSKRSSMILKTSAAARKPGPIAMIANYSLHAANRFACAIPIGLPDPYSPNDHWQWSATQWRGIIGPDLVIYIRDAVTNETSKARVEIEGSDKNVALFVVGRSHENGSAGDGESKDDSLRIPPSVLRRVGFEVSEWVRAFDKTGK